MRTRAGNALRQSKRLSEEGRRSNAGQLPVRTQVLAVSGECVADLGSNTFRLNKQAQQFEMMIAE